MTQLMMSQAEYLKNMVAATDLYIRGQKVVQGVVQSGTNFFQYGPWWKLFTFSVPKKHYFKGYCSYKVRVI